MACGEKRWNYLLHAQFFIILLLILYSIHEKRLHKSPRISDWSLMLPSEILVVKVVDQFDNSLLGHLVKY